MRSVKSKQGHYLRSSLAVAAWVAVAGLLSVPATEAVADEHEGPLAGKHIAFLVAEGVHDAETLVPLGHLANRGARVTVVGPSTGLVDAYNSDIQILVGKTVDQVDADDFDGLVIPGGRSPANLRQHEDVVAFARAIVEAGKPVAAICHGPQVLVTAGVLEGKTATAVGGIADELREAGAEYVDVAMARDGNIITSRVPGDLPDFCAAFEAALLGSE